MILEINQQLALDTAKKGGNIFINGKSGTGKSTITKLIIEELRKKKKVVVLGSTGVAAANIKGETFHSFFSIKPFGILTKEDANYVKTWKRKIWAKTDVIVIDEISMIRPDIFDTACETMLKNGINPLKKQWIIVGDFGQLKPVLPKDAEPVFYKYYTENHVKDSYYFKLLNFNNIELTVVKRQSNPIFINSLNCLRNNKPTNYFNRFISNERKGVVIASTNRVVNKINEEELAKIDGDLIVIEGKITGDYNDKDTVAEQVLKLKDGCKVMYLVNKNNLVNGTVGIYRNIKNKHYIEVENQLYYLELETFGKYTYDENLNLNYKSSLIQLPIKVCFALTTHKCQGLTFDEVTIDYTDKFFEENQEYVAMSRVRSPKGLKINNK